MQRSIPFLAFVTVWVMDGGVNAEPVGWKGKVVPTRQVVVSCPVDGTLSSVNVAVGNRVRKGQPLAEFESKAALTRLSINRATLKQSEAELRSRRAQVERERCAVKSADVERGFRRERLDHLTRLHKRATVSAEQVSQAKMEFELAEFQSATARANLDIAEADLRVAEAKIHKDAAREELAKIEVAKHVVRAPIDGVVVAVHRRVGESALAHRTPLIHLMDQSELNVEATAPIGHVHRMSLGQAATLTFPELDHVERIRGKITRIAPVVRNGKCAIWVSATMPKSLIRAGTTATVSVEPKE